MRTKQNTRVGLNRNTSLREKEIENLNYSNIISPLNEFVRT